MLGVRLRKSACFTRWDARPLSDEQVGYAREDVLHLLQLADALQATPARPRPPGLGARGVPRAGGRLRRARRPRTSSSACRASTRSSPPSAPSPSSSCAGARTPRASTDRPVPSVLADAALVEVAKRRPGVARAPRPDPRPEREHAAPPRRAILEAVERGRERDADPGRRRAPARRTDAKDAPLIALGEALVRARASEAELAYELLAARADLQRIVTRGARPRAPSPTCARCRAGGARSSATSCSSCCRAAARCASGPAERSRSPTSAPGTLGPCADCSRSCSSAR